MVLILQIYSIVYSFCYGIFLFFLLEINYRLIYNENIVIKFIFTFFFAVFNTLLYFIGLKRINNGIVHVYFLLIILLGYILSFFVFNKLKNGLHNNK